MIKKILAILFLCFCTTHNTVFAQHYSKSSEEDERAITIDSIGLVFLVDGSESSFQVARNYIRATLDFNIIPNRAFAIYKSQDPKATFTNFFNVINQEVNAGVPSVPQFPANEGAASLLANQLIKDSFSDPNLKKRLAASLAFTPVPVIPPEYSHIQQFPVWILFTENGQILLEGLPDIQSVLTKDGKFIEPLGVEEAAVTKN
jgi:hypothetical protein